MRLRSARAWMSHARVILSVGVVLSLLLSAAAPAFAAGGIQGNLNGTVVDAKTHTPIADVLVTAKSPSGNASARTDSGGHFTMLGLSPDTYTVSFSVKGYQPISIPGVAVFGDMMNSVGQVSMSKELTTIARVVSHARNSAFQPQQTQDTTTISGARITQALGNPTSNNEQNLILAAPGAIQDAQGNITVRGSLSTELGYQYDGVNFSSPFFDGNQSGGYINNLTGGSGGSLQVVSGAGDATQGNIGAGVINIVPPRGTYPAQATASMLVGEPYFDHQLDLSYSWSTPDNRISDFVSYDGQRSVPQYAPVGVDASQIGQYYGSSYTRHDDIQNNLVFRFGHNHDMSLQWLFRNSQNDTFGNYGGLQRAQYYPYNPNSYLVWAPFFPGYGCANAGANPLTNCGGPATDYLGQYDQVIGLNPGVPATNMSPTSSELVNANPLHFNKIGYTWNMNPSTFLNLQWANEYYLQNQEAYTNGCYIQCANAIGGQRIFGEADLTHQFGANHTVTLAARYQDDLPLWNLNDPFFSMLSLGFDYGNTSAPTVEDFYLPANPGQPVSAANPCVGGYDANGNVIADPYGCYVYDYMIQNGLWNGSLPRMPEQGIDYHHSIFHEAGIGLRDQWDVSDKLHLDYGVRIDTDKLDFGCNQFGGPTKAAICGNPSDLPPSKLGQDFLNPKVWQPRFAAAYQLNSDNSLRFSYGRSVNFFFAQTAGTPFNCCYGLPSFFKTMPSKDTAAGQAIFGATGVPVNAVNPACGSGYNPAGSYWTCSNYAQSIYWIGDQFLDAPDYGGQGPPTYNNWDLAWGHQFARGIMSGFGMKLTGFARRGYNIEENTLIANGPPNPVTGQTSASVFQTQNNGVEKTYGLEFMLTSPDRPHGLTGFLTMNYISEFWSAPPVDSGNYANDSLPILFAYEFNAGQLYRSAFLPPFQGRLGLAYKTLSGWKVSPIFAFDGGYPVGIGSQTYAGINGAYAWVHETNFGAATPLGGPNGPGNPYNASYFVDPANPGSYLNPNIAASRGYAEPALPGNKLTNPHGTLDLDLEYSPHGSPLTFGTYISNVFNNHYGLWYPNQQYQAVATGVSGPQSGTVPGSYPGSLLWQYGNRDAYSLTDPQNAFRVPYNAGTTIQFYITTKM